MVGFPRWKIFFIVVVTFFGIWFSLPNFVSAPFLPSKKLNLGLDLRGGSQLLLEIDYEKYQKEQLAYVVEELRKTLNSQSPKIGYRDLGVEEGFAVFTIREPERINEAKGLLTGAIHGVTAVSEGDKVKVTFSDRTVIEQKNSLMAQSIEIIRRRVDETGTKEPTIQSQGNNRILLQVAGAENPEEIKQKINTTAKLNFHMVKGESPVAQDKTPDPGYIILADTEGRYWEVEKQPMIGGENLVNANQTFDMYGRAAVAFKLDNRGGKIFGDVTRDNVGKLFASVLDNVIISAPRIQEPIMGGSGQITGSFTSDEATKLATLLRAGALPAQLKILEERTVGASLGQDSINAGTQASYIATLLVAIFMIVSYGFFGFISVIALIVNLILIIAGMSVIQSTMTLPGIAGIALTTGIAVDANVLIFERIREEIRNGKKPYACIEQGFDRAFATITDSNVTALISSILLYIFGTGTVKGFAVTLSIGIIASMFTAIMLSRFLITLWLNKTRPTTLKL